MLANFNQGMDASILPDSDKCFMPKHHCKTFHEVLESEVRTPIQERRAYWDKAAQAKSTQQNYPPSDGNDLVGVALSGGGIRSSMFNLGLLQAFQRSGLMKHVDYLSSVSGGGYTNGYYSTLGHFRHTGKMDTDVCPEPTSEKTTDSADAATSDSPEGLSARDAQFLLDGQYLNRPIEFLTDYLLKTAVILFTAIAGLLAAASLTALYFRCFDNPGVRTWLGLLDLNSDLRVGLFSCFVLAFIVLVSRFVIRRLAAAFGRPMQLAPGQWAVLTLAIFLLGVSIMIGNGDFYVSNGMGFLPEKLDLKSLQLPILVVSILLFSPMLRFGKLLQSEKVNATLSQKLVLWIVLFGTSWGIVLGIVGWVGRENISGFIDNRPPTFVVDDILNFGELALLLERKPGDTSGASLRMQINQNLPFKENKLAQIKPKQEFLQSNLDELVVKVWQSQKIKESAETALRQEDRVWDSWSNFSSQSLARWANTLASRLSNSSTSSVNEYIESSRRMRDNGVLLSNYVDRLINPSTLSTSSIENNDKMTKKGEARHVLTNTLFDLAVARISSSSLKGKAINDLKSPTVNRAVIAEANEDSAAKDANDKSRTESMKKAIAWIEAGGKMVKKDLKPYKDISSFSVLLRKCFHQPSQFDSEPLTDLEEWQLNRMFLEIAYPTIFKERAMISTSVVVGPDQEFRLVILAFSTAVAVIGFCFLDLNKLSPWFQFYRRRIGETFLQKAHRDGIMKLRELNPTKNGYPYPLFVSAMILPQAPSYHRSPKLRSKHANPCKLDESFASNWYSYLLSPLYCGWLPTGKNTKNAKLETYRPTTEYLSGELGVDDAVVLSGAAMTPFMASNPCLKALMHLFNIRLEQWLPNPRMLEHRNELSFSLIDMGNEWKNQAAWGPDSWSYGVVADGGFREFLGVEELVARRCRILIVSDAGCNNGLYEFGVLADLIRKLRLDHSIEVLDLDHDRPLDTRRLKRSDELEGRSPQHFVVGRIRYPEKNSGQIPAVSESAPQLDALLVYVQMSLTGDENIDIEQFRRTNPSFPDEPISNQFYTPDQVESFRQLGEHIGRLLCRDVDAYDCPSSIKHKAQTVRLSEPELRDYRIRRLEDAFCSTYRNECRQESAFANDDAGIGWMLNVDQVLPATLCCVHRYETASEHQLLIRDFVWYCLEDFDSERAGQFDQIKISDLFGIAIECNRRHAGFRPEWPTSFFQIAGRDLLIKASQLGANLQLNPDAYEALYKYILNPANNGARPPILNAISRLAVMLPRGVFRLSGGKTAAEVLVCLIGYLVRLKHQKYFEPLNWILRESSQKRLRLAIETGKAIEVEQVLIELINEQYEANAKAPTSVVSFGELNESERGKRDSID